jgi:hypothetical protein
MALRTHAYRVLGGLTVSAALLGVLPGQASASTSVPPTPAPVPAPAPAPATMVAPDPVRRPDPAAPGRPTFVAPEDEPSQVRVPRGAPATGGGSTADGTAGLIAFGALGLAGAAGAAGAGAARRRRDTAQA